MGNINISYLLLGGNLGDVPATFSRALRLINNRAGKVLLVSSLYQSKPWGFDSDDLFINQVIIVNTHLDAEELLLQLLEIETILGRKRRQGQITSRLIDIDILFFNNEIIDSPGLQVPHPRLHLRRFTMVPLAEIQPAMVHPVFKKTMAELLDVCPDKSKVTPLGNSPGSK